MSIFLENLIEILLGLVVTFNIAAYSQLWRKIKNNEEETDKNSESLNTILQRIFGIEKDPTDKGHIMETEKRFDEFAVKLGEISEKQDSARESRERMERNIRSIMEVLAREERIDIDKSDFDD